MFREPECVPARFVLSFHLRCHSIWIWFCHILHRRAKLESLRFLVISYRIRTPEFNRIVCHSGPPFLPLYRYGGPLSHRALVHKYTGNVSYTVIVGDLRGIYSRSCYRRLIALPINSLAAAVAAPWTGTSGTHQVNTANKATSTENHIVLISANYDTLVPHHAFTMVFCLLRCRHVQSIGRR